MGIQEVISFGGKAVIMKIIRICVVNGDKEEFRGYCIGLISECEVEFETGE